MSKKKSNAIPIGIDLGTTYCSIAYYDKSRQQPELFLMNDSSNIFASHVQFRLNGKKQGIYVAGQIAKESNHSVYDAKRLIGKTFKEYKKMINEKRSWGFEVKESNETVQIETNNPFDRNTKESFYPEEISAFILKDLIKVFKTRMPHSDLGKVVVTFPADFTSNQQEATKRACELAGIENVEFFKEPLAAIVEYKRNFPIKGNKRVIVIDLGGGTLDICICDVKEGEIKVIATGGDQNLGGNNFDRILMDLILEKIEKEVEEGELLVRNFILNGKETEKQKVLKEKSILKLKLLAELTKKQLSNSDYVDVDVEGRLGSKFEGVEPIEITKEEFEQACENKGLIQQLKDNISQIIKNAKLSTKDIDLVVRIGGSCHIPIVRKTIASFFPKEQFSDDRFDPLTAVAKGAATRAYQLQYFGNVKAESPIKDVLPYSIGVKSNVNGKKNYFSIFAKKGETLPIQKVKYFLPEIDNQTIAEYPIYIGECEYVHHQGMKFIQNIVVQLPSQVIADDFIMKMIFSIDKNGKLSVKVVDDETDNVLVDLNDIQLQLGHQDTKVQMMLDHMKVYDN